MELLPLGPVLFIDTAGIDDTGALGELRIHKTQQVFDRTDLGVIISEAGIWGDFEEKLLHELKTRNVPAIAVFNKSDLTEPEAEVLNRLGKEKIPVVTTGAGNPGPFMVTFKEAGIKVVPVVAANRIGTEDNDGVTQSYYGHSFIADHTGTLVASFGDKDDGVLVASFDLDAIARYRAEWGFFRDRRTDLYAKSIL